jgi:SAM-dependent methyltransferase
MADWTHGYVAEIGYTHGYYRELTPAMLGLAALAGNVRPPDPSGPLVYCELGCGQGFSANLIAAASPFVEMHAIDFNPAHVAGARMLAAAAALPNATFHELGFEELSSADLPVFDIIALHGVWSWISAENRRHVIEFVRHRLRPGGLLYVSYNTLPGWAAAMPLRRLLVDHGSGVRGSITQRIDRALESVQRLVDSGAAYFNSNPNIVERFTKMRSMGRDYLAHEYFNRDWSPFYHADVASELSGAKVTFVGSVHLLDYIDTINFSPAQKTIMMETSDSTLRETMRDFITNQQFRRDVFVKGPLRLSSAEARRRWQKMRFALSTARGEVPAKVSGPLGEALLQPETYDPVLDAFADGPRTVEDVIADHRTSKIEWPRLLQALLVLVGAGHLQPALDRADDDKTVSRFREFNKVVMERSMVSGELNFLSSPVIGGGVAVDRILQLFILAIERRHQDPVTFAWEVLVSQGQRIIKDERTLESIDENLAELRERFASFSQSRLAVLKQMGIA